MGKKIFVSYKYSDSEVFPLNGVKGLTTARDYVDEIEKLLEAGDNIYKGEDDGEDIGSLSDATISSKLGDKIFDSSITIVLISKGMKDNIPDKDQWIPWEISYSLREQSRDGERSKTNAMLAVVLPDKNGSYDYFMAYNQSCLSVTYNVDILFKILKDNMFNLKDKESNIRHCNGVKIYNGYPSYIHSVRWENIINGINPNINIAVDIWNNIDKYEISKIVE